jgi:hypothetical protein
MQFMASSTLRALGFTLAQRLMAELWSSLHPEPTDVHACREPAVRIATCDLFGARTMWQV